MDEPIKVDDHLRFRLKLAERPRWVIRFCEGPTFRSGLSLSLRPTPLDISALDLSMLDMSTLDTRTCDVTVDIVETSLSMDFVPRTSGCVTKIPRAVGQAIFDKLRAVRIGVPERNELGCDGTTYALSVHDDVPALKLTWWHTLPPEWIDLQPVIDDLLSLGRRVLGKHGEANHPHGI